MTTLFNTSENVDDFNKNKNENDDYINNDNANIINIL